MCVGGGSGVINEVTVCVCVEGLINEVTVCVWLINEVILCLCGIGYW